MLRRLAVAVAVVVGMSVFAFAPPAQAYNACPANTECGWLFYSDATHTHWVGTHTTNCQGILLVQGVQSGYSVYIQDGCGGGSTPPVVS